MVASNDLDEFAVGELKSRGARITVWGIGTKLATAYDQPALGGVYKLGALRDEMGRWEPRIKLSELEIKVSNPGRQGVRRYTHEGELLADMIYNLDAPPTGPATLIEGPHAQRTLPEELQVEELLLPIMRGGRSVYAPPPIQASRERTLTQLSKVPDAVRRFEEPARYPTGLEESLHKLKRALIERAKEER